MNPDIRVKLCQNLNRELRGQVDGAFIQASSVFPDSVCIEIVYLNFGQAEYSTVATIDRFLLPVLVEEPEFITAVVSAAVRRHNENTKQGQTEEVTT